MCSAPAIDVLLVEDSPGDANLVRLALKEGRMVHNIHHVTDGVEALAYLRHEGEFASVARPDLILLDLNMPRMNGRAVLSEIKSSSELCGIPVIALTTSSSESDVEFCYKHGVNAFISKPVDLDKLFEWMKELEVFWFAVATLPPKP